MSIIVTDTETKTKTCPRCEKPLPLGEFGVSNARADRLNIYCKRCNRERTNQSRMAIRDRRARREGSRPPDTQGTAPAPAVPVSIFKSTFAGSDTERVTEALKSGAKTQDQLLATTRMAADDLGVALADLLLWDKRIGTEVISDNRVYYLRRQQPRPSASNKALETSL